MELDPLRQLVGVIPVDRACRQVGGSVGIHILPRMKSLDVFTQAELDQALARDDVIPVCAADGRFEVGDSAFVRAADSATVVASGSAVVDAGGLATIVARGRSQVLAAGGV